MAGGRRGRGCRTRGRGSSSRQTPEDLYKWLEVDEGRCSYDNCSLTKYFSKNVQTLLQTQISNLPLHSSLHKLGQKCNPLVKLLRIASPSSSTTTSSSTSQTRQTSMQKKRLQQWRYSIYTSYTHTCIPSKTYLIDEAAVPLSQLEACQQGGDDGVPGRNPEHGNNPNTGHEGLLEHTLHHQPTLLPVCVLQGSLLSDLWCLVRWRSRQYHKEGENPALS